MSFVKIALLIFAFKILPFCRMAEYERFGVVEKRGNEVKACGPILTELLAKYCGGIYNGKRADHRIENVIPDSDYYYNYEVDPGVISGAYPFRTKRSVSSVLRSSSLKRAHGIVDECCNKWCTISELTSYCG